MQRHRLTIKWEQKERENQQRERRRDRNRLGLWCSGIQAAHFLVFADKSQRGSTERPRVLLQKHFLLSFKSPALIQQRFVTAVWLHLGWNHNRWKLKPCTTLIWMWCIGVHTRKRRVVIGRPPPAINLCFSLKAAGCLHFHSHTKQKTLSSETYLASSSRGSLEVAVKTPLIYFLPPKKQNKKRDIHTTWILNEKLISVNILIPFLWLFFSVSYLLKTHTCCLFNIFIDFIDLPFFSPNYLFCSLSPHRKLKSVM